MQNIITAEENTFDSVEQETSLAQDAEQTFGSSGEETSKPEQPEPVTEVPSQGTFGDGTETATTPALTEQEKDELKNEIQEELNVDTQEETEPEQKDTPVHSLDDLYKLLSDYMEKQETYQTETKQYYELYAEQSKNILSTITVLALILGFTSGIILARIVWRKL